MKQVQDIVGSNQDSLGDVIKSMLSTKGSNIKLTQVTFMIQEILKFTAWLTTYPHEKF